MTQKELLYMEDAIGHEKSIINIICNLKDCVENDDIRSFLEKDLKKHESFLNKLIKVLEEKSDER